MPTTCRYLRELTWFRDFMGTDSRCYVADGDHALVVTAIWAADANSHNETRSKTWSIDLVGNSGYVFEILRDSESGQSSWRLTCNNDSFSELTEKIPIPNFSELSLFGNPVSGLNCPNEVSSRFMPFEGELPSLMRNFVLSNWRVSKRDEQSIADTHFGIQIVSRSAPVISAMDAESTLTSGNAAFVGDYLGDGRFLYARARKEAADQSD